MMGIKRRGKLGILPMITFRIGRPATAVTGLLALFAGAQAAAEGVSFQTETLDLVVGMTAGSPADQGRGIILAGATAPKNETLGAQRSVPSPATAEAAAAFIGEVSEKGTVILTDPEMNARERVLALRRLFAVSVEVDAIKRFVLGKYWRRASAEEKAEYRELFEDYIVATYAGRIDDYEGETLNLGAARLERPGLALVNSQVMRLEGPPVAVDWRLRHGEKGWRILDIVIQGISLAITQRAEFASVIRDSGGRVEGLLAKLRQVVQRDQAKASSNLASSD
jgi:phospholipid transport system substrate-binding protein